MPGGVAASTSGQRPGRSVARDGASGSPEHREAGGQPSEASFTPDGRGRPVPQGHLCSAHKSRTGGGPRRPWARVGPERGPGTSGSRVHGGSRRRSTRPTVRARTSGSVPLARFPDPPEARGAAVQRPTRGRARHSTHERHRVTTHRVTTHQPERTRPIPLRAENPDICPC